MTAPINREAIYTALLNVAWAAYTWGNPKAGARRLKLWADVPLEQRPALYQFEGGNDNYTWTNNPNAKRTLPAALVIYTDAKATDTIGATQINTILDALDLAFQPVGRDEALGRFTLGGLVYSCRIEGAVFKDPGDLDGDGMIKIPISIVVP